MNDEHKAVFLSYASQDAEAAKRICDALRQAGVEVWFDQSELRGGDAWDASIRKQIKECALFVPVISANTNARAEGYFRLEWKLAVDRSHLMADDAPFIFPVVVGDVTDATARVPDKFRDVQWTRLRLDEAPTELAARVAKLLSGDVGRGLRTPPPGGKAGFGDPALQRTRRPAWLRYAWAAVGVTLALVYALRPLSQPSRKGPEPDRGARAEATPAPLEAQKLVQQAQKIYESSDELDRETLFLADDLVKRALALDPAEPSAWLLGAQVSYEMVWQSFDASEARKADLQRQAARARALAPESVPAQVALANARVAVAYSNFKSASNRQDLADVERDLLALAERAPHDYQVQRALGQTYRFLKRSDEALHALQRALELSGGDPGVSADVINVVLRRKRYAEAEAIVAPALARRPIGRILVLDVMFKTQWRGDLAGAQAALATWPGWLLREDRGAFIAWQTWLWSNRPDRALDVAERLPRDYLHDVWFTGPRAVLTARAHELAGHREAAQADWRTVVSLVDRELAGSPDDAAALFWKTWALSRLGDQAGAEAVCTLLQQRALTTQTVFFNCTNLSLLWSTMGRTDLAAEHLRAGFGADNDAYAVTRAMLELDPAYAALRADPHFAELAAAALAPAPEKQKTEDGGQKTVPNLSTSPSTLPDAKSVAVLPFENRSAGGEDSVFLADGIHEDLINTLSRVPGLKVMSRTAVQRFKVADAAMPDIAAALKVSHVVEAGVQREGNQVRINVQLVRTADGQTVWSERYDRVLSAGGIFALQEEITAAVAKALQLQLEPGPDGKLIPGTTKNLAAYEAFLKGRLTWKNTGSNDQEAIALFKRAVELDPGFALAYGAMAEAYVTLGNSGAEAPARVFPLAKAAADRALAIDPRCIQALTALGEYAFHYEWDWDKADRLLRQALVVDPNYANAYGWLAGHLRMMNRAAEANVMLQRKVELEPERPIARLNYERESKLAAKQYDAAVALARQIADQARGQFFGSLLLGGTLREAGRPQEARPILEQAVAQFPDQLKLSEELGLTYAALGQTAQARELLTRLAAIRETRFVSPLLFASIAASLNDRDLAFAEITRAFEVHDPFLPSLGVAENLASLKDDPRFREVLKRLKLDTVFPEAAK